MMEHLLRRLAGDPLHPVFYTHAAIANLMISVSYVILTVTVILVVVIGFRHRSYGMPLFGITALLGIAFICAFPGPAIYPHLFLRIAQQPVLHWMWRGWFVLHLVLFFQYLLFVTKHPRFWPELDRWTGPFAVFLLALVTYAEWSFIVFYQDSYINEVYPVVILVMSINYVVALFWRVRLRGLSLTVAWGWFVGNLLLYAAIVMGGMTLQYPCHDGSCAFACEESAWPTAICVFPGACPYRDCRLQFDTGYDLILLLYAVTILANVAYVIGLTRRRQELRPDWDVTRTLTRMSPRP